MRAGVLLWETAGWTVVGRHQTHHAKVQDLAVSPGDTRLLSLGGSDDKSLVVWDIQGARAVCSQTMTNGKSGPGLCLVFSGESRALVGGKDVVQSWELAGDKITATNCSLGKLKRELTVVVLDQGTDSAYFGTTSGDIVKIALNSRCGGGGGLPAVVAASVRKTGPGKPQNSGRFSGGVTCILLLPQGQVLVGCGDGEVVSVGEGPLRKKVPGREAFPTQVEDPTQSNLVQVRSLRLEGAITSLLLCPGGSEALVSTSECCVYRLTLLTFDYSLLLRCPARPILSCAFPAVSSRVFCVGGEDGLQLWTDQGQLKLHIPPPLPSLAAMQVQFSSDGRSIVSGWSDAAIRLYTPQSGKLSEEIRAGASGNGGVTGMAVSRRGDTVLAGGGDGSLRLWSLGRGAAKLVKTVREHRGKVCSVAISKEGDTVLSCGQDGAGIVWEAATLTRLRLLKGTAGLARGFLHPNGVHAVTLGVDSRLGYWDLVEGGELRSTAVGKAGQVDSTVCITVFQGCSIGSVTTP